MNKYDIANNKLLWPSKGVLSRLGEDSATTAFEYAYFDSENSGYLTFASSNAIPLIFEVQEQELNKKESNNTISFESSGYNYIIRSLREEDGIWMSNYQIPLPVEVLEKIIDQASESMYMAYRNDYNPKEELLVALALPDSDFIYGLMYSSESGDWIRVNSEWVLMSPVDNTFEDSVALPISPNRAEEYIEKYDSEKLTISDTETYEEKVSNV
jgi:hypothetical protein